MITDNDNNNNDQPTRQCHSRRCSRQRWPITKKGLRELPPHHHRRLRERDQNRGDLQTCGRHHNAKPKDAINLESIVETRGRTLATSKTARATSKPHDNHGCDNNNCSSKNTWPATQSRRCWSRQQCEAVGGKNKELGRQRSCSRPLATMGLSCVILLSFVSIYLPGSVDHSIHHKIGLSRRRTGLVGQDG